LVIAVMMEMLQLIWAWFGIGLTIEPTFEEFSLFCNHLLMSKSLDIC